MLKWTFFVGGGLVVLVVLVAVVGWFLPRGHHASVTGTIGAPPSQVFDLLVDVTRYPEWRHGVKTIELLPDDGEGTRFREDGPNGAIVFRIEHAEGPNALRVRIDDRTQPFGGTWTYVLTPIVGGTRLTITEDGEVYNAIFRFLSRFVFSQTATMEQFVADLKRAVTGSS